MSTNIIGLKDKQEREALEKKYKETPISDIINNLQELQEANEKRKEQIANLQKQKNNIFALPKLLVILKIIIFLDDNEVANFACTCKYLYQIIYSPIGFRLISSSRSTSNQFLQPKGVKSIQLLNQLASQQVKQTGENKWNFVDCSSMSNQTFSFKEGEDTEAQMETLKSVKDFLVKKLIESQEHIKKQQQENNELRLNLMEERFNSEKNYQQMSKSQSKLNVYLQERKQHSNIIQETNQQHQKILEQVLQENKKLKQDCEQYQNHKKIFVAEIIKLREELSNSNKAQNTYKESLKKVKNSLEKNVLN